MGVHQRYLSRDKARPTCGIFGPDLLDMTQHIAFIRAKSPIRRNEELPERILRCVGRLTLSEASVPAWETVVPRSPKSCSASVFPSDRTRGSDYRPAAPVVPAGPYAPVGPIGTAGPYITGKLLCPINPLNENKTKYTIITSICTV